MPAIQLLPASVAERIAAGEVIDRPASVVRELIENAIDAGSTAIRIEARGGGLQLIRIADDGCGIPAAEIELALRRHATSKLRELADLERVETLGFRGEALASIAAVAEVTILSATDSQAAQSCTVRAGRPLERLASARARGTTVTVRDLFSAMPARLKFMRGARAEAGAIGAVVRRYALARPDLRLTLVLEGHVSFRSDGSGDLREALAAVYGDAAAEAMLPVGPLEHELARIGGLIGGRGVSRANRSQVSLFVNRRYVRSRPLLTAIEEGYHPFLPRGRHALAVIALDLPPAALDVNIHPAKLDVRLQHEAEVEALLTEVVRRAYGRHPSVASAGQGLALAGRQRSLPGLPRRVGESERPSWGEGVQSQPGEALPALRLVGQIHDSLIVAEAEEGLFLIDQHRAHERIIFERLLERGRAERQALIEPAVLDLAPAAAARLGEHVHDLEALGITCEEFGPGRFILRSAPTGADLEPIGTLLPEMLREALSLQGSWHEQLLASLACRAAIRKGRPLNPAEAADLIRRLGGVQSPAVCPHGSPVILHLTDPFLARQFGWG